MALRAGTVSSEQIFPMPPEVAGWYSFPSNSPSSSTYLSNGARGQTIAILEFSNPGATCGFAQSDIDGFIEQLNEPYVGGANPSSPYQTTTVKSVTVPGSGGNVPSGSATNLEPNGNDGDLEVALDIEVVVSVAQGASVVVYFAQWSEQGWVDAMSTIVADQENSPSVLSISYGYPELTPEGDFEWTQAAIDVISSWFVHAGVRGITVLVSTGDKGATCGISGGKACVQYPASDPGVIACGGTQLDAFSTKPWREGTWSFTGGGISYVLPVPSWQSSGILVPSANQDGHQGRGIPDVAGYASPGYWLWLYGQSTQTLRPSSPINGTSATAPLYASLIAMINAALDTRVGYLNPFLYSLGGSHVFHDIADGIGNEDFPSTVGY